MTKAKRNRRAMAFTLGSQALGAVTPPVFREPAKEERELSVEEKLQEKLEDRRLKAGWRGSR